MFKTPLLQLSLFTVGCLCATSEISLAQVTTDNTVNTQVEQNGNVAEITGGETRGGNLFHSFQDFSIPTGNEAFFNNANDISNILSRVTGGNVSNIDGLIRANGSASLFLINPAGIIFGENASLNIGGSFYGSSASSILFEDGEFSATDLENPPLLTVNAPIGLGFRDNPGDIVNRSTVDGVGLQVSPGETIGLIGGDINLEGGLITAPGGRIELGGLTETGAIDIADNGSLSFPNDVALSNVLLSDNAEVDITSDGGGLITVNANNLELTGASKFLANIGEGLGSENAVAGTIQINSTSLSADNNSLIHSDNLGTGQAGTINITTDTLNFASGSAITTTTFGAGDAGRINITAQDISIDQDFSGIYSNVGLTRIASDDQNIEGVVGNGGVIKIDTDTLSLTNGARIASNSIAQGNAGTIDINATGEVSFIGQGDTFIADFNGPVISGSSSQVQQDGVGNSGQVNIKADSLTLIDTGAVLANNSGAGGDAGDITLDIQNNIFLDQTGLILAQVQSDTGGNAGDITITASSFEARGGSFILADTRTIGNAGDINIDVEETVSLDGDDTLILTEVQSDAVGNAGDITITANSVVVKNSANIIAQTKGQGNAGNITINTSDAISLENDAEIISLVDTNAAGDGGNITLTSDNTISLENESKITSEVKNNATGNGGNVSLTGAELNLTDNSRIIADTGGRGAREDDLSTAGNIDINVAGDINLDNGNQIQSEVRREGIGNAGNITINTDGSIFSTNGNLILANSQANGNGGSITITAREQILLEGFQKDGTPSQIIVGLITENAEGIGGNIVINASELILKDIAAISSDAVTNSIGSAGDITINVDSLSLSENAFINVFTANDFDGGEITINAQTLDLGSGGKILAATDGGGDAGNINLNINGEIKIDNSPESSAEDVDFGEGAQLLDDLQNFPSGIYANATKNSTGSGGNVNIGRLPEQVAENFVISNNARIVVGSEGSGSGGSIFLNSKILDLDNNASISAFTNSGQGGEISLQIADELTLDNNSSISAQALNNANGGNINIDTKFIIAFPSGNNDIFAIAEKGNGGNITINAESLFGIQERPLNPLTNDIDASSEFSLDGNVTINTPEINSLEGTKNLPQNIITPEQTTAQACNVNREVVAQNSFTIKGKGGVPPLPELPLSSHNILINGENANSLSGIPPAIATSSGKIQPARGIKVNRDGGIVLTAYRTNNSGERLPAGKQNCDL